MKVWYRSAVGLAMQRASKAGPHDGKGIVNVDDHTRAQYALSFIHYSLRRTSANHSLSRTSAIGAPTSLDFIFKSTIPEALTKTLRRGYP